MLPKGRGTIYNKNCAASSLDDKQESIKRDTLIAALRQGMTKDTKVTAICDGANNCWSVVDWKCNTLLVKLRFSSQIKPYVPSVDSILYYV